MTEVQSVGTAIVIFAKAPIAGYAKTRLIPALGEAGAAELARQMLLQSVAEAIAADVGPVILAAAPSVSHPIWKEISLPEHLLWRDQGGGDLGERLARGAQWALERNSQVLLMGTDCPQLTAPRIREAAAQLSRADVCMVPVADGGYALLGLKHTHTQLFEKVAWSTAEVSSVTRSRCAAAGLILAEMPELHDVDEPADLKWLRHPVV